MRDCIESVSRVLSTLIATISPSYCCAAREFRFFSSFSNYRLLVTLFIEVISGGMHPGGQEYRSMADIEGVAASFKGAALPETLDLVVGVPKWCVSDYCARYERLLDAHRFAGMFSEDRSKSMVDDCGMCHDKNIGA